MKITILTLFPEMFQGPFDLSIIKRAKEKKLIEIDLINIRDFGIGKHKSVDDTPYGGGVGMIMRIDVLHTAIEQVLSKNTQKKNRIVLMSAAGKPFHQAKAKELSMYDHLILICGHYEGVDERILAFIDEEISIGDFVSTGGELPAMLITDAVTRLLPGVISEGATESESFSETAGGKEQTKQKLLVEHPQYTNPREYRSLSVPDVLVSGNHKMIAKWREEEAKKKTSRNRPDISK